MDFNPAQIGGMLTAATEGVKLAKEFVGIGKGQAAQDELTRAYVTLLQVTIAATNIVGENERLKSEAENRQEKRWFREHVVRFGDAYKLTEVKPGYDAGPYCMLCMDNDHVPRHLYDRGIAHDGTAMGYCQHCRTPTSFPNESGRQPSPGPSALTG